ncbi:MAG TPA: hypothetical protein VMW65_04030, partial [Chloroflexota bacterium]|nr:hypothetical protein [Chloroflexota bacterium]
VWPGYCILLVLVAGIVALRDPLFAIAPLVAAIAVALLGLHVERHLFGRIYLVDQSAAPGLLRRNRDIILMFVGVMLGVLIPVALTLIHQVLP